MGARHYSPALSRWLVPDPLGEKYYDVSPYAYCAGNPVMFVDDNGADIVLAGKNKSSVTVITDRIDIQVNLSRIGVDWGGNSQLQGEKILSTALDIAGLFDPTGTLDVTNAGLQWKNGNHLGSLVSLIGVIPYAGDIAKAGRISKEVKAINTLIKSGQSAIDKGFKSL